KAVFSLFSILNKTCTLQLGQMGRYAALAHCKDFLKFRNRQFLPFEQQKDANAAGVGDQLEAFQNRCHYAIVELCSTLHQYILIRLFVLDEEILRSEQRK